MVDLNTLFSLAAVGRRVDRNTRRRRPREPQYAGA